MRGTRKVHTLIFAGGTGTRVKSSDIPKQFIEVGGKPIVIHALDYFSKHPEVDDITVACLKEKIDDLREMIDVFHISKVREIIAGGETGYDSIDNGLKKISEYSDGDDIVLICDGVRPILSQRLISECIDTTCEYGSAVPVTRSIDSVMISEDGVECMRNMSREKVYVTQAPQGYLMKDILDGHRQIRQMNIPAPVSSADMMIILGRKIRLFAGDRNNIKVTTDEDLQIIKALKEIS